MGVAVASLSLAAFTLFGAPAINLDTQNPGVTVEEVQRHVSAETGVWVVLNGNVYDLTEFMASHPGGAKIIMLYAGKDALAIFNKFHAPSFIEKYLSPEQCLGPLIGEMEVAADITEMDDDAERQDNIANMPPISEVFRVSDFEYIARKILSPSAWYYYSGGSDDEITMRENHNAFLRIFFNPRVLVDVSDVDMSTTMLGAKTDAPFYCSAAAQAKLGHRDGELSIARGCGKEGIIQMISHYSSFSMPEIVSQAIAGQTHWYQLYILDRTKVQKDVEACKTHGLGAIFVTVDTPELGRREKDMKLRARMEAMMGDDEDEAEDAADLKSSVVYGRDLAVTWTDIADVKSWSNAPVAIKGVQCVEDVVLAAEKGVKAVVLSNHGGRQLDYARAPVEVLADVMPVLREKGLADKIEIYVDGGIRRGSDVVKCVALGAKGVGLGRVFLYANAAYGEEGVRKACQLLKDEIHLDMKLLGVTKLSELGPHHLDLRNLYARNAPPDYVYNRNYEPLTPPAFRNE